MGAVGGGTCKEAGEAEETPKAEASEDGVALRISADSASSGPSTGPSRASS